MDAATISDAVNTAARIESLSKYYGVSVLLSEASLNQIENKSDFQFRFLGKVQVKGKQKPVNIYECFNGDSERDIQKKLETLPEFEQGLKSYYQRDFSGASRTFQQVLNTNPKDKASVLFHEHAKVFAKVGVSEDWEGIEMMKTK